MFVEKLSDNLKSNRRFPEGFKSKAPYNILTLLDPRYADLYFTVEELESAVDDLCGSNVYRKMAEATNNNNTDEDAGANMQVEVENNNDKFDSFATRRRILLAARREDPAPNVPTQVNRSLKEKIQAELEGHLKYRGCLEIKDNPCRVQPNPNNSAESEYIRNRIVPFLINRIGIRTIRAAAAVHST